MKNLDTKKFKSNIVNIDDLNSLPTKSAWIYLISFLFAIAVLFASGLIWLAAVELIIITMLFSYHLWFARTNAIETSQYIQNLAFHIDNANTKDELLHFPLPLAVINTNSDVIWYNALFSDEITNTQDFEDIIKARFTEINIQNVIRKRANFTFNINLEDKSFEVIGKVFGEKSPNHSVVLYLINRTLDKNLQQQLDDSQAVIARITIDNYDDFLTSGNDKKENSSLLSDADDIITKWIDEVSGVSYKTEADKYIILFHNKFLQQQITDKFKFMDEFQNLNKTSRFPITLSIGIGSNGGDIYKNDTLSLDALDMAMGRGGDQVVIKQGDEFQFFGGRSMEYEKRTKVKPRLIADALQKLLTNVESVFIMGHKGADCDSIGAAAGLAAIMRSRGIQTNIVLDTKTCTCPDLVANLIDSDNYDNIFVSPNFALTLDHTNSLLIVVDCHKPSYMECTELLNKIPDVVIIDHHRRDADFLDNASLAYHEPYASSTCELVVEIIEYMGGNVKLTREEVFSLYAGIVMDTKNFTFKTGVRTFEAASYLRVLGVDTIAIKKLFQTNIEDYKIRANIISASDIYRDIIAISTINPQTFILAAAPPTATPPPTDITADTSQPDESTANTTNISTLDAPHSISHTPYNEGEYKVIISQTADELLSIKGVEASFILYQHDDKVAISARALNNVNVQIILESLGGGGHTTMAGADVDGNIESTLPMLKQAIDEYLDA
ncbi:MAG: DHH family phosphoesterase [Clostridiales bacterium]|jgi:c-di-AMP phosphodiesterase-like protein|nr:DHH family phosphoesterase [Clostridiales bacterium]